MLRVAPYYDPITNTDILSYFAKVNVLTFARGRVTRHAHHATRIRGFIVSPTAHARDGCLVSAPTILVTRTKCVQIADCNVKCLYKISNFSDIFKANHDGTEKYTQRGYVTLLP